LNGLFNKDPLLILLKANNLIQVLSVLWRGRFIWISELFSGILPLKFPYLILLTQCLSIDPSVG
jgi:hypothetical protein